VREINGERERELKGMKLRSSTEMRENGNKEKKEKRIEKP